VRPASNLADLLARAAQESPEQVALVEAVGGRRTTWAELDAEADRVAQGLSGLGLVAGYRVMIALANRTEFVAGPVRVHDSRQELTRLARTFLDDFIDSSVPAAECVRNFSEHSDRCRNGKANELDDLRFNRDTYTMLPDSRYTIRAVTIGTPWAEADIVARCEFHARHKLTGDTGVTTGTCELEAVYEEDRWWLCTSSYRGRSSSSLFISIF